MYKPAPDRITSLDLLKGLVMVIMALDHVRDYFHNSAFIFDPTDPQLTNTPLYLTRWITHFCAPAFSFLAGISAYLVGKRKSNNDLSLFLIKRGVWLVLIELTVVTFAWYFDIRFEFLSLLVIWSLGVSMIILAGLIRLEPNTILVFSLILIFGHNLLDYVHIENNLLWSILHQFESFNLPGGRNLLIAYPIIPWVGVMSLGYFTGSFFSKDVKPEYRKRLFSRVGYSAIALFVIIRLTNQYGNPSHWQSFDTIQQTLFSFFNPSKYPPSLTYLLMTLGPSLLFLAHAENLKGKVAEFFIVFGRVPFFYYILHLYAIHVAAFLAAELTGFGWKSMVLTGWVTESKQLAGYGFDLWAVYLIWIAIVAMLFPLCKKFSVYKLNHREKTWLSYF